MSNDDTFDQETIAALLADHGVDAVEELPAPVRNNIREGPAAEIDPFEMFRPNGDDADEDTSNVHVHVHVDGGDD